MFYIIRYNADNMIALFSRQPDGKHIGMIIYLVEYFLDFFPTGNGYVSAVVQYAVYSAGRDAGHACYVFNGIVLVFHLEVCCLRR